MFIEYPANNREMQNRPEQVEPSYEQVENVMRKLVENGTFTEEDFEFWKDTAEGDLEIATEALYTMLLEAGIGPDEFLRENIY